MLCPGCGNEIEPGAPCAVCEERRRNDDLEALPRHFCTNCGNEYLGDACPDCVPSRDAAPAPPPDSPDEWEQQRRRLRTTLCAECGAELPHGQDCQVCTVKRWEKKKEDPDVRFCSSCGNAVYGFGDCPVCATGRAPIKRETRLRLCPGCGNEVEDVHQCPICEDGRSIGRKKEEPKGKLCPRCHEALEEQDWDGVPALLCMSCQGVMFFGNGLEHVLDRLRETAESDLQALVEDYRERLLGTLPRAVRYKKCPLCREAMVRRNYKGVVGMIIDVCGRHGTWVDQATFGELSDFVTSGGDTFLEQKRNKF